MKSPVTKLLVQEHADQSFLQRQRTYLRHGLNGEAPVRNVLGDYVEESTTTTSSTLLCTTTPATMQPTTTTTAATLVSRVRSRVPGWAKVALGAAVSGPLAAAAVALGYYLKDDGSSTTTINNPPAVQPVHPSGQTTTRTGGDLLEWLEHEGYNRP